MPPEPSDSSVVPFAVPFVVPRGAIDLAGEQVGDSEPRVVLLHSGITDRRGWRAVTRLLDPDIATVAYDRRGFGDTPRGTQQFRHLDDLVAVLDDRGLDGVWLVGSSAGGAVALECALSFPDRVAGLVLLAPAVPGAPPPEDIDADTERLDAAIDAALAAGDLARTNRLEAHLWLDGPAGPEGRVGGPARELALAMNAVALGQHASEDDADAGVNAWDRLAELRMPTTLVWGHLDVPVLIRRWREMLAGLPAGRGVVLEGCAHLPYLERPDLVADVVRTAVRR